MINVAFVGNSTSLVKCAPKNMYRENLQNNKYWTKPYMTKQDNIEHDKNVPKRDREIKILVFGMSLTTYFI
jgi:hypothetical protein